MPRDGSQQYSVPPGTDGIPDFTIESTKYNTFIHDVEADLNAPRPIGAGGTGANNVTDAMNNLGGELARQVIVNYNSDPFQAGSFYSAPGATGAPSTSAFTGICYVSGLSPALTDLFIEARDQTSGTLYVRQKKANVWTGWTTAAGVAAGPAPPPSVLPNTLWWDNTRGKLFIYYQDVDSSQWVEAVAVPAIDNTTYVKRAGDTMTGILTLSGNPVGPLDAVPMQWAAPLDALAYSGMQINGAMEVSQANGASVVSVTSSNPYILDGWFGFAGGVIGPGGFVNGQQVQGAGFPGLPYYISLGVLTAVPSLAAADGCGITTRIEGFRIARLAWGSSNAQPITIGFWSNHVRAGIYSVGIRNGPPVTRCFTTTYNHAVGGVSQYNTISIPGCIDGVWTSDNTTGMQVSFTMAAGSAAIAASANTWLTTNTYAAPGQINGVAATTDQFRITGVVILPGIEAPSAARSALIMRPFDQELLTCQRYWQKTYDYATAPGTASTSPGLINGWGQSATQIYANGIYKTKMRTAPTVLLYSYLGASGVWTTATNANTAAASISFNSDGGFGIVVSSGLTLNAGYYGHYTADARL